MKSERPKLTRDQRQRLLWLAKKLDRVPASHFDMRNWVIRKEGVDPETRFVWDSSEHHPKECGYAGCAIGWGFTSPRIRAGCKTHHGLANSLGLPVSGVEASTPGDRLFGSHRRVTPKRVASDIRRYLKDGTLPV